MRIGSKAVIGVTERDPRCKMITLDPDTSHAPPEVMKMLAGDHGTRESNEIGRDFRYNAILGNIRYIF